MYWKLYLLITLPYVFGFHVTHLSDCGKERGCWLLPAGCDSLENCDVILTWKHKDKGRALLIEMEANLEGGSNGGWIAIGYSRDDRMGNDTVLECQFPTKEKGSVRLSHNLKSSNIPLPKATQMLLKDAYTEIVEGRAQCGVELMLDHTVVPSSEKKMLNPISSGKYHLIFAKGSLDAEGRKRPHAMSGNAAPTKSANKIRICHHCSQAVSILDQKVDL